MGTPHQQQSFQRKLIYLLVIVVLFTASWVFRRYIVEAEATRLALREETQGDVHLVDKAIQLSLTGSRGIVICVLWIDAQEMMKKNQWSELELVTNSLTKLQPHFITPWMFQSWNLSYNVSVEADRVSDKYYYICKGIQLLARGERQNRNNPDLRFHMGVYYQSKFGTHDAKEKLHALFQLSCIDPVELNRLKEREDAWEEQRPYWRRAAVRLREIEQQRDRAPAAGRAALEEKVAPATNEFKELDKYRRAFREEFIRFAQAHPQLVRRLREKVTDVENTSRKHEMPEDVVRFVRDNTEKAEIPTLYDAKRVTLVAGSESTPLKEDVLDRFPVLPPDVDPTPPQKRYLDPVGLNAGSKLDDSVNCFGVGRTWFCYAQWPLPEPDPKRPGKPGPIEDRIVQRIPKKMYYMLFRNFPPRAQAYVAERLEEDGWFDERWNVNEAFPEKDVPSAFRDDRGTPFEVGEKDWTLKAWKNTYLMWANHGTQCVLDLNLVFGKDEATQKEANAARFQDMVMTGEYRASADGSVTPDPRSNPKMKQMYEDWLLVSAYRNARVQTNFIHFWPQARVEQQPDAILAHKYLYQAEQPGLIADFEERAKRYEMGLNLWRELLEANDDLRDDSLTQEDLYEAELKYLTVFQQMPRKGQAIKKAQVVQDLAGMLAARPDAGIERILTAGQLMNLPQVTAPRVDGPLDMPDAIGKPFIGSSAVQTVGTRTPGLARRAGQPYEPSGPPPGMMPPPDMQRTASGHLRPLPPPPPIVPER